MDGQYAMLGQWRCGGKTGHVLGFLERRRLDGHHLLVLLELRKALDMEAEEPGEVSISGILEGGKTIICSVCGQTRYFSPSEAALERFLERRVTSGEVATDERG